MRKVKKLFVGLLLLAVVLRIVLLMWSVTYPLDINGDQFRFEDWAQSAHIHGVGKTYESAYVHTIAGVQTIPNNQPPGTMYMLSGAYESYIVIGKIISKLTGTAIGGVHWVNTYLLHIMMRVPSVLADIGIGVLLYLLVKEKGEKRAILAASLIWFNPIMLYNSTIWGQTDAITSFFFLLSISVAFKKKYILALLAFASSVYIKLSLLPLLPFYLVFLYIHSGKQWKKIIVGLVLSIIAVLIATYPISSNPIMWLASHWPMFSRGEAQNISVVAFNFWWAVTCLPTYCPNTLQSYDLFLGIPMELWAYLLFALVTLPILYLQWTKPKVFIQKKYVFLVLSLVALAVFLFMPRMHDRYLYPFFPLFACVIALSKHIKTYLIIFCLLTVLHMGNLLSSWYPTRYPSVQFAEVLYSFGYRWSISVLTVVSGIYVYVVAFKDIRLQRKR